MEGTPWEIHLLSTYMITYCLNHGLPTPYTISWERRSDFVERSYTATTQRGTHSPPTGLARSHLLGIESTTAAIAQFYCARGEMKGELSSVREISKLRVALTSRPAHVSCYVQQ
jgi:hypothetical protein